MEYKIAILISGNGSNMLNILDACKKNGITTINEVLSKGCDINFADYDKRTALHIACSEKNIELANLLIDKGIRIEKDRWGNLPFDDLNEDEKTIIKKINLS